MIRCWAASINVKSADWNVLYMRYYASHASVSPSNIYSCDPYILVYTPSDLILTTTCQRTFCYGSPEVSFEINYFQYSSPSVVLLP